MENINELTDQDRLDLAEICCHPESELTKTCETLGGKAMRLSIGTGYDLLTNEGTLRALSELVARSPTYSWFSTPCTSFCAWQHYNEANASEKQLRKLKMQRQKARRLYKHAL